MLNQEQQAERSRLRDEIDRLQADIDANGLTDANARAIVENQARINALSDSVRGREFHDGLNAGLRSGRLKVDHGTESYDDRAPQLRDKALRTVDAAIADGTLNADGAEVVERAIEVGPPSSRSWSARWAAATGDPNYLSAFTKKVFDPDNGHLRWTPQEGEAWRTVTTVQAERAAMSTSDTAGGFLIPFQLDPTILLSSAGSANPLRQMARIVQCTGDSWNGVSSEGAVSHWYSEAAEVSDDSPTLAQPTVPVYRGSTWIPFSVELESDGADFVGQISRILIDSVEQLTAKAYVTGAGGTEPTGFVTALAASNPSVIVSGDGSEALAASDAFKLQNALPPRFQAGSSFAANLSVINTFRQFETANGSLKFPALQNNPPYLLGRPCFEVSNMDSSINAAATEANYLLVLGDFNNFVIADRIGTTVELVPWVFGASRRPTGQRGFFAWFRTGSDVLVDNAFRMLNVATTA